MAIRKHKHTDDHFIKALNPRNADQKYMGDEPFFPLQPDDNGRKLALTNSFTWYNRFYGKNDAKEFTIGNKPIRLIPPAIETISCSAIPF